MKERPILFKDEMIRAILEGRKTQTRRVVKPQPETMRDPFPTTPETMMADGYSCNRVFKITERPGIYRCLGMRNFVEAFSPYGQPGDRLWVREAWAMIDKDYKPADLAKATSLVYRADGLKVPNQRDREIRAIFADRCRFPMDEIKWRPSIHMPRVASRLTLEITGVRVERLQDISYQDAQAEGVQTETADPWFYHISTERNVYDFAADEPQGSFRKLWESINGPGSWMENPWVWVIEFKRVQS